MLRYGFVCSPGSFHQFVQPGEKPDKFTWLHRQSKANSKFFNQVPAEDEKMFKRQLDLTLFRMFKVSSETLNIDLVFYWNK